VLQEQLTTTLPTPEPEPEVPEGAYLSDVSPRDKPWDEHRDEADAIQEHYNGPGRWYGRFLRMQACGQGIYHAWVNERGAWRFKLQEAHFCRAPGCPICQWRRSMKWQSRFLKALPKIQEAHPKARWVFLSLTLRNCPVDELGATLDVMAQAWHRLLKRKEFRSVLGWVRALEVTKNHKNGSAHPHVHALLMVRPSYFTGAYYVTQPRWAELWAESLRIDYTPIVDVKAIKDTPEALRGAVFETLKYSLKPGDLADSQEWFLTCMAQLQKRRLISSGGVLKGILHEDKKETNTDLLLLGEGDRAEMEKWVRFDWRREVKRYQKSKRDPQG